MSERLDSHVNQEIVSFKKHAPIYEGVFFKEISAGSMNNVYELVNQNQIIHITPNSMPVNTAFSCITEPHFAERKGMKIAQLISGLEKPTGFAHINIASLCDYGEYTNEENDLSYWIESKLDGMPLTNDTVGLDVTEYASLLTWIANIQNLNTAEDSRESLTGYYDKRLINFELFFKSFGSISDKDRKAVLDSYRDAVQRSINPDERTSFVHGDLNSSNILISRTDNRPVSIGVIDFEKSIYYGDPLVDPMKLLLVKHDYIIPNPQYSYIPPLIESTERKELLESFLNTIYPIDKDAVCAIIENRHVRDYLIHIDTILSVLAYRTFSKENKLDNKDFLEKYLVQYYTEAKEAGVI